MKKKTVTRMLAFMLAATTVAASLSACGQSSNQSEKESSESVSSETETSTEEESSKVVDKSELPVITLYPANANLTSGLVTGYKADYFAENGFQMEVWAYSDEKTNAILASGDLPDIMYVKKGENLETMIEAGMLLDLSEYMDQLPHLYSSEYMEGAIELVKENHSAGTGGVYGLPLAVGDAAAVHSWVDSTDRKTVKLRWDVYEEIGAPEINDYWELIDVMEQMLAVHPQEEDGTKCYGTYLDNGQDSTSFGAMQLWYQWQGYHHRELPYLLETNLVTGEVTSILSEDSLYYEGLKWYNEVYRRGLLDPDSINTDRSTQAKKIDAGYAMVPSGTLPGWAPKYYEYYIPGTNIFYDATSEAGDGNYVIAINADTEYLEECLKILDMWCDPDAVFEITMGPDGDIWYSDGDNAYLTDAYMEWLNAGNSSYNNFPMSDGSEFALWNTNFCVAQGTLTSWKDGNGNNRPTTVQVWSEAQEVVSYNENFKNWQETTGYTNWRELLAAEDALTESSPMDAYYSYASTAAPDDMQLTISALRDVVVTASWNMVYAESEADFDAIWEQMLTDCEELNAQSVIDWRIADLETAKGNAGAQ